MPVDLRTKLTLLNWEAAVRLGRLWSKANWKDAVKREGITIDLSRVEWVEPTATLRAVLLAERALLDGLRVMVRMPRRTATARESRIQQASTSGSDPILREKAEWISRAVRRRRVAGIKLDRLEFRQALEHEHLRVAPGDLEIVDEFDWSGDDTESSSPNHNPTDNDFPDEPTDRDPWYSRDVYPLRWVGSLDDPSGQAHLRRLAEADVMAGLLTHGSERLSFADGSTLASVFMKELVENAIRHGRVQFALVTAWCRPPGIGYKRAEVLECERKFFDWCAKYHQKYSVPLVEICVGDSGLGIPQTLGPEYAKQKRTTRFSQRKTDTDNEILAWAFHKWSTSKSEEASRGTRGLYRVERIVRKYDGLVTIRSGQSHVGIDCGSSSAPQFIVHRRGKGMRRLGRCPGTVAHVRLPVMLAEKIPARSNPVTIVPTPFTPVDLSDIQWSSRNKALQTVRERIIEACNATDEVIVADLVHARLDTDTLYDLLSELTELAHPIGIVVINLGEPHWDACLGVIAAMSEPELKGQGSRKPAQAITAEEPDSLHIRDPILLRHVDGHLAWVGVPQDLLHTIYNPLLNKGFLSYADLTEVEEDAGRRNHLIRLLRERYHLLNVTPDGIRLKVTPEDIEQQAPRETMNSLTREFQNWSKQKERTNTVFLTPTLKYVRSFVNVSRLLERFGVDRVTRALATKCVPLLWEKCRERPVEIVADSRIAPEVVDRFCQHLSDLLPVAKEVKSTQIGPDEEISLASDSVVLAFADIIFTASTLHRLISQIVRAKGEIIAIATVFDTRKRESSGDWFSGRPVPFSCLCEVEIWSSDVVPEGFEVKTIGPETRQEEKSTTNPPDYILSHEEVAAMVVQQQALYFDHIVRPNGRHFCQYLDPMALLVGHQYSRRPSPDKLSPKGLTLVHAYQSVVAKWLDGLPPPKGRSVVCYPDNEQPSAAWMISLEVSKALNYDLSPLSETAPPLVPPVTSLTDEPQPYETAIVIDWGALSGQHIRDSIRLAATAGVRRILVVVFLSQMPANEEIFLRQLHSVSAAPDGSGPVVEVAVRFLARFPIRVYDPTNCPHCLQLARISAEEGHYTSKMLRQYAGEVRERLRKVDVFQAAKRETSIVDSPSGRWVAPEDILAMTAIRENIVRARGRTDARRSLMEELRRMSQDSPGLTADRRRIMKLLASEWTLLKQEPLLMPQFKDEISRLARIVIKDVAATVSDRMDAIVVHRTASKRRFAQHLFDLFVAVHSSEPLVRQLMYCAFTFLQRDYQVQDTLNLLVEALAQIDRKIEALLPSGQHGHMESAFEASGEVLHKAYYLRGSGKATPMGAWGDLRLKLMVRYHNHASPVSAQKALRISVDDLNGKPRSEMDWNSRWRAWRQYTEPFLTNDVYQLVAPLGAVFARMGDDRVFQSGEEHRHLSQLVAGEVLTQAQTLRSRLLGFARHPELANDETQWQEFEQAREWIWNVVVNPGTRESTDNQGASTLVKVVAGCPSAFSDVIEPLRADYHRSLNIILACEQLTPADNLIFIHRDLLRECLVELFQNANFHNDVPEGTLKRALVQAWASGDRVRVIIRNNGVPNSYKGDQQGVRSLRRRLATFDAELVNGPIADGEWTYEVQLSFLKWRSTP